MSNAYIDGLKMLSRRELSEAQVRQRLARKDHPADDIDAAITRLREERAIDDVRVAETIARTETSIHRRGKIRVRLRPLSPTNSRMRDRCTRVRAGSPTAYGWRSMAT